MEDEFRKKLLREQLKKKAKGQQVIQANYRAKYPDSMEREYMRVVSAYMVLEKQVVARHLSELKDILAEKDIPELQMDSKKEYNRKRRLSRFISLDNTFQRLRMVFRLIRGELEQAFGMFGLRKKIEELAGLGHKLTIQEWKKTIRKTFGIDLLEDYYSGDAYQVLLKQWVSENVELICTVPNASLDKMRELVCDNYMEGKTAMDIIKEMQKQYGIDKRHAMLIARDQTAKLNAAITQHQQQEAGIESYTWSTSWDDRVRDSHRKLDGKPFRWDDPPETEKGRKCHPGQDYQCRCCAIPITDIDKLELPV